jgi:hypothetical protein
MIRVLTPPHCEDGYCGRLGCSEPATSHWFVVHAGPMLHARVRFCTEHRRYAVPGRQLGQGSPAMIRAAAELRARDASRSDGRVGRQTDHAVSPYRRLSASYPLPRRAAEGW